MVLRRWVADCRGNQSRRRNHKFFQKDWLKLNSSIWHLMRRDRKAVCWERQRQRRGWKNRWLDSITRPWWTWNWWNSGKENWRAAIRGWQSRRDWHLERYSHMAISTRTGFRINPIIIWKLGENLATFKKSAVYSRNKIFLKSKPLYYDAVVFGSTKQVPAKMWLTDDTPSC